MRRRGTPPPGSCSAADCHRHYSTMYKCCRRTGSAQKTAPYFEKHPSHHPHFIPVYQKKWLPYRQPLMFLCVGVSAQRRKAGLRGAPHRFAVYGNQAKVHSIALLPLKVIHQAPVEVSLDRNTISDAVLHTSQCASINATRRVSSAVAMPFSVTIRSPWKSCATLRITFSSACG